MVEETLVEVKLMEDFGGGEIDSGENGGGEIGELEFDE